MSSIHTEEAVQGTEDVFRKIRGSRMLPALEIENFGTHSLIEIERQLFLADTEKLQVFLANLSGKSLHSIREETFTSIPLASEELKILADWCTEEGFATSVAAARNFLIAAIYNTEYSIPSVCDLPIHLAPFFRPSSEAKEEITVDGGCLVPTPLLTGLTEDRASMVTLCSALLNETPLFMMAPFIEAPHELRAAVNEDITRSCRDNGLSWAKHQHWLEAMWTANGPYAKGLAERGVELDGLDISGMGAIVAEGDERHPVRLSSNGKLKAFGYHTVAVNANFDIRFEPLGLGVLINETIDSLGGVSSSLSISGEVQFGARFRRDTSSELWEWFRETSQQLVMSFSENGATYAPLLEALRRIDPIKHLVPLPISIILPAEPEEEEQ